MYFEHLYLAGWNENCQNVVFDLLMGVLWLRNVSGDDMAMLWINKSESYGYGQVKGNIMAMDV